MQPTLEFVDASSHSACLNRRILIQCREELSADSRLFAARNAHLVDQNSVDGSFFVPARRSYASSVKGGFKEKHFPAKLSVGGCGMRGQSQSLTVIQLECAHQ